MKIEKKKMVRKLSTVSQWNHKKDISTFWLTIQKLFQLLRPVNIYHSYLKDVNFFQLKKNTILQLYKISSRKF